MTRSNPAKKLKVAPEPLKKSAEVFEFRMSDFRSVEMELKLINTTTGLPIEPSSECLIVEFLEDGLLIEVPYRSCAQGHHILANLNVTMPDQKTGKDILKKVEFTGKIRSLSSRNEGTDSIELVFIQRNEKEWREFQAMIGGRQDEVNTLLKAIRGW